jgi:hypothetical protein
MTTQQEERKPHSKGRKEGRKRLPSMGSGAFGLLRATAALCASFVGDALALPTFKLFDAPVLSIPDPKWFWKFQFWVLVLTVDGTQGDLISLSDLQVRQQIIG